MDKNEQLLVKSYCFDLDREISGDYAYNNGDILINCLGSCVSVVSKTPMTIAELRQYYEKFLHREEERYERRKKCEEAYREYKKIWGTE